MRNEEILNKVAVYFFEGKWQLDTKQLDTKKNKMPKELTSCSLLLNVENLHFVQIMFDYLSPVDIGASTVFLFIISVDTF